SRSALIGVGGSSLTKLIISTNAPVAENKVVAIAAGDAQAASEGITIKGITIDCNQAAFCDKTNHAIAAIYGLGSRFVVEDVRVFNSRGNCVTGSESFPILLGGPGTYPATGSVGGSVIRN